MHVNLLNVRSAQLGACRLDKHTTSVYIYQYKNLVGDQGRVLMTSSWKLDEPVSLGEVIAAGYLLNETFMSEEITVGRMMAVLSKARRQFFASTSVRRSTLASYTPMMTFESILGDKVGSFDSTTLPHFMLFRMARDRLKAGNFGGDEKNVLLWAWLLPLFTPLAEDANVVSERVESAVVAMNILAEKMGLDAVVSYLADGVLDAEAVELSMEYGIDPVLAAAAL